MSVSNHRKRIHNLSIYLGFRQTSSDRVVSVFDYVSIHELGPLTPMFGCANAERDTGSRNWTIVMGKRGTDESLGKNKRLADAPQVNEDIFLQKFAELTNPYEDVSYAIRDTYDSFLYGTTNSGCAGTAYGIYGMMEPMAEWGLRDSTLSEIFIDLNEQAVRIAEGLAERMRCPA